MTPHRSTLGRRDLLRGGAALFATAALPGAAFGLPESFLSRPVAVPFLPGAPATKRVVLVVFGGGVRAREMLGSGNTPNLDRIAEEGVVFNNTYARNNGHYGSATNIFTGRFESYGIRENARSADPTLFEYIRRDADLPSTEVWLSTAGSDQETNYAYSAHGDYGYRFGANLIGGEGIFNAEFREVIAGSQDRLPRREPDEEAALQRLRGAIKTPLGVAGTGQINDPEATARIESYILDELQGGTTGITGIGANDAKSLRVARNLMAIFKPRLLGVTLRNADIAHGSFNDYVTVIRRNDEEVGRLFAAIRGDAELADSTAVFVLPEFGRDRDLNTRRGLDHGDGSDDLHKVQTVAWGPDFRSGKVVTKEVQSIDVCPTIADMFGVRPSMARGGKLPNLFA